jgi:hypothetical protein
LWGVSFVQFCSTLCVPIDEITTEQHLRHHLHNWRLRQTPKLLRLKLHCIWTWGPFFSIFHFVLFYLYIFFFFNLLIFYFYSYLNPFFFIFNPLSVSLMFIQLTVD